MASERQIEQAFLRGVSSIADGVRVTALKDALRSRDYLAILEVIDIEDSAFDQFRVALTQTYAEAGTTEIADNRFPVPVRWNSANPRVEAYARNTVGGHISLITEDMRGAVRNTVADGYAFGRSIDRMALDLVGRVGPSGHRKGGVVGLNAQQAQWLANMRRLLQDDPAAARRYGLRDKRFDRTLAKGEPLTAAQIDNITRQYSNKLLLSRGRTIAQTERGLAINAGRQEAWLQAADKAGIPYDRIIKTWRHTGASLRDRPSHLEADGDKVQGLLTPFIIEGESLLYPHDPMASARQTINCRCEVRYSIG